MCGGFVLRRAGPGDESGVAAVHIRGWQAAYEGLLPASFLAALDPEDRAGRYTFADGRPGAPMTVIAVAGDAIIGFATIGVAGPDAESGRGELLALYVDPDRWGTGVGRALIVEARRQLGLAGVAEVVLWVLAGNCRAERFYRRDGWRATGERRRETIGGVEVEELRYRRALP